MIQVTFKDGAQFDLPPDLRIPTDQGEYGVDDLLGVAIMGEYGVEVLDRFVGIVGEGKTEYRIVQFTDGETGIPLRVVMEKDAARMLSEILG